MRIGDCERRERIFGPNRRGNTSSKEAILGHSSGGIMMAVQFFCFLSVFPVSV